MILRTNGSLQNLQKTFYLHTPWWCGVHALIYYRFNSVYTVTNSSVIFCMYQTLFGFCFMVVWYFLLLWIKILSQPFSTLLSFVTTCSCWDFYCRLTLSNFFISWTTLFNEFTLSGLTTSRSQEFELLISRTTEV